MKKISFLFVGMLALLATSCGFKSEEKPLTENLITYTAEAKNAKNGEVLLGVKDKTGKELIKAQNYTGITADDNIIVCTNPDNSRDIYTLAGMPVGDRVYSSFLRIDTDSTVYYTGKAIDNATVFYFPDKEVIKCNVSYMSAKNLYAAGPDNWNVYTLDGSKVWSFVNDASILKDESSEEIVVAVPTTKGKGKKAVTTATLYAPDGKVLKNLNAAKWKAFVKKLPAPTEIGSLKLYELKTLDLKKL